MSEKTDSCTIDADVTAPVLEAEEEVVSVNYNEMSIADLAAEFENLAKDPERMSKHKEAEMIKAAFYKKLLKEKETLGESEENPFSEVEEAFKAFYNAYKKEKAEYNAAQEKEREANLVVKKAVIEDLKELIGKQEDVNVTFPAFREIQNRWREAGPVPAKDFRGLNETYQLYVEQFYDMVKINRDLRDLDFKKNLEAKEEFCKKAEELAAREDVISAFKELQKLHEQWKEFGPVEKEFRESIWNRFKEATAVINKKYQAYFEAMKDKYEENLAAKTVLCEKVEAFVEQEIKSSNEWNTISKSIEDLQKEWREIGFAAKKDNQKIYERFRAACDSFYEKKRVFYAEFKDSMNDNLARKISICEQVEALKNSTEWKKTTDKIISLQKEWKEIGAVPRKKADQLWKRFRGACDEFFEERDKHAKENDYYGNLKAKQAVIEEIKAFKAEAAEDIAAAQKAFNEKFQAIGFVPFKEKDNVNSAFREAMNEKFGSLRRKASASPRSEKDRLMAEYNRKEQEIVTFENNIGFFARSKNADKLVAQIQQNIDKAKEELKALEAQIRALGAAQAQNDKQSEEGEC
ncbi:MAG: DUF349 domain-containing protein [Bacteroidales bacterium]|nr:DUF349 domain-containing protein [Bacteroidales bacterium]